MVALVVQLLSDNFALRALEVTVVHCNSCGSGNDRALASICHIHQQHQSASRVSVCGRKSGYSLRVIACK